jgi:hypothetical protein
LRAEDGKATREQVMQQRDAIRDEVKMKRTFGDKPEKE